MANFVHFSNVNNLFKKKNEQVWQSRNQAKLASPTLGSSGITSPLVKPKKRFPLKVLLGIIVFALLLVGGVSAMILSQVQQDVRQRATGCTYWNGEPATEGASDNRGGVMQICRNGYWSNPQSSNTSNSSTSTTNSNVVSSNAQSSSTSGGGGAACGGDEIYCGGCISGCRKATQTCNRWIDQECVVAGCGGNGTRPGVGEKCCEGLMLCTNGRCDPTCSANIGTRQCGKYVEGSNCNNEGRWVCDVEGPSGSGHCEGGLWSNPVQEGRDEISRAIGGLDEGRIDYSQASTVYNEHCRDNAPEEYKSACSSLDNSLREEANEMRWQAMDDKVSGNTNAVTAATTGLQGQNIDYAAASTTFNNYCNPNTAGSNYNYTSTSACNSLESAMRDEANRVRWQALEDKVNSNTNEVAQTTVALSQSNLDYTQANNIYNSYCNPETAGANYNTTSTSACESLTQAMRDEANRVRWQALEEAVAVNNSVVSSAITQINDQPSSLNNAQRVYNDYCVGSEAQQTSASMCDRLSDRIEVVEAQSTAGDASTAGTQENNTNSGSGSVNGSNGGYATLAACYQASQQTSAVDSCSMSGDSYVLKPTDNPLVAIINFSKAVVNNIVQPINEIVNPTTVLGMNNRDVLIAQSLLSRGDITLDEAQNTYDQYCTGAVVSPALCANLNTELEKHQPKENIVVTILNQVGSIFGLNLSGNNDDDQNLTMNPSNWVRPLLDGSNNVEELRNNDSVISLNDSFASADSLEEFDEIARENTTVIEANTWEEVAAELWQSNPELYAQWQENYQEGGHNFDDPEFIAAYNEARNNMNANYFNGVIVVSESDYRNGVQIQCNTCSDGVENMSLVGLEYLTYVYPMSQRLEDARAGGILVPSTINLRIVVVPDKLINQQVLHQPKSGIANIPTAVIGGEEMPWPPDMNWLFFDNNPMVNGLTVQPVNIGSSVYNVPVATGLIHEELHVLGPSDYYETFITDDSLIMNSSGEIVPTTSYLSGWDNLSSANFGGDDIMSNPSAGLTSVSAFEVAIANAQGITSTMQEGNFYEPSSYNYNITVRSESGENLTPDHMVSFGQVVRDYDYDQFADLSFDVSVANEQARLNENIPMSGSSSDLPPSQMMGISVQQDNFNFTLPLPNRLDFYQLISNPTNSSADTSLNLSIEINDDLQSTLEDVPPNSNINVTILSDEEIRNMESSGGVILATAPLEVNSNLVEDPNVGYQVVWVVNP